MKWRRLLVLFGVLALAACSERSEPWFPDPPEEEEEDPEEEPGEETGMTTAVLDLGAAGVLVLPA